MMQIMEIGAAFGPNATARCIEVDDAVAIRLTGSIDVTGKVLYVGNAIFEALLTQGFEPIVADAPDETVPDKRLKAIASGEGTVVVLTHAEAISMARELMGFRAIRDLARADPDDIRELAHRILRR